MRRPGRWARLTALARRIRCAFVGHDWTCHRVITGAFEARWFNCDTCETQTITIHEERGRR